MRDIAVVMSVAGADAYFNFASFSIPSFLRNNISSKLFVFTDNSSRISKPKDLFGERLHVVDLRKCFEKYSDLVKILKEKAIPDDSTQKRIFGFHHCHIFVSALLPIAEYHLQNDARYSHILKIDCDSYFAGGDMMELVKKDVRQAEDCDLFLIERNHPLMKLYSGGVPGVGFTLWKKGGRFISKYINKFENIEQTTILRLCRKKKIRFKILTHPGYHFVYPFHQAEKTGIPFTKDVASKFLPAYFHLHGKNALKNMEKMEGWFKDA